VRYCGIEVSPHPALQRLVTLHERRSVDGLELVATFYEPGSVEQLRRTIEGFGRGHALVGIAARHADLRACDELLDRRGLPASPFSLVARELMDSLAPLGPYRPFAPDGATAGRVDTSHGRIFETCSEAAFCALLGHLPPPEATPYGMQQRIAVLKMKGVVDPDGGLWHRATQELDACAAAYTAYSIVAGTGSWHGDPREGVIVLPVAQLSERYQTLPPPRRERLV
jgi:hypothetical protein